MKAGGADIENFRLGKNSDRDDVYQEEKRSIWHYIIGVLLTFSVISIIVLFSLVGKVNSDKNYYQGAAISVFTAQTSNLAGGKVVSLAADGSVQNGAGTSIYKNIAALATSCTMYLSMDSMLGDAYIVSSTDSTGEKSTLTVVTVGATTPDKGAIADTSPVLDYPIVDILTLNSASGLFVGLCQDINVDEPTDFIVAGTVEKNNKYAISALVKSESYVGTQYSVSPSITRLSDTEFAIAFYGLTRVETRYGKVNPATLAITFTAPVSFAINNYVNFNLVSFTATSYALVYFEGTNTVMPYYGWGVLTAKLATLSATGEVTLSAAIQANNTAPIFTLATTRMSDTSAIIAYSDYSLDYAINTQLLTLSGNKLSFSAYHQLTSAPSAGVVGGGQMDLDVAVTSDDGKFLVLYSDFTNNGAMTVIEAQVTDAQEIITTSPDVLLNDGSADMNELYSWGALAVGSSTPYASRTAILTSVTNYKCAMTPVTNFAMREVLPGPFGLTPPQTGTISKGSSVDVCVSGVQNGFSKLPTGYVYYANTKGDLVQSAVLYGREGTAGQDQQAYYYDAATNTIVSPSSRVGFAASTQTIFVQP